MAIVDDSEQNPEMASDLTIERVRRDVEVISRAGLDLADYFSEIDESLRRAVPYRAMCAALVDPVTRLCTGTYKLGELYPDAAADALWGAFEYGEKNPTSFGALADRAVPATASFLERVDVDDALLRQREFLTPNYGFDDEARVAAVANGRTWGGVALHRRTGDPRFTDDEIALLASLAPWFAVGIRAGILVRRTAAHPMHDLGPAVLIVAPDGTVVQRNASADAWLEELDGRRCRCRRRQFGGVARGAGQALRQRSGDRAAEHAGPHPVGPLARAQRLTAAGQRRRRRAGRRDDRRGAPARDRGARGGRVRAHPARTRRRPLRAAGRRHQGDRRHAAHVGVHGPGPPQVDLREGRRAQPSRADLGGVLRPVRPPHGHRRRHVGLVRRLTAVISGRQAPGMRQASFVPSAGR